MSTPTPINKQQLAQVHEQVVTLRESADALEAGFERYRDAAELEIATLKAQLEGEGR